MRCLVCKVYGSNAGFFFISPQKNSTLTARRDWNSKVRLVNIHETADEKTEKTCSFRKEYRVKSTSVATAQ